MTVWPMVERELRTSARQRFTFHLRLIGATSLLIAAAVFGFENGFVQSLGGKLFGALHLTLFAAIWIFVPFLTADCISRERREGTLGLLMLTRLNAGDVVLAKSFAHALRAMTLWLAVLPIMAVPFLMGGVSWRESLLSVCVNLSSIFLALSAGLLGSSVSRVWSRVLVWVACLSLLLCCCFVMVHFILVAQSLGRAILKRTLAAPFFEILGVSFQVAANVGGEWSNIIRFTPAQRLRCLEASGLMAMGSAIFFWLAIWLASRRVRRCWREEAASERARWFFRTFCRPVFFRKLLRRWMQYKLRRNPIGWLEQRSWSGRLISWIWLGLVMAFAGPAVLVPGSLGDSGQVALVAASVMVIGLALSATASFRRERETGVLELLLVSPLGAGQLISGRVRGLWMQFLPGAAVLVLSWIYAYALGSADAGWGHSEMELICFTVSTFLAVPVIGLYLSLRFRSFPAAFLATLLAAAIVPPLMAALAAVIWWGYFDETGYHQWEVYPSFGALFWQFVLAALSWLLLWRSLRKREFAPRTSTAKAG